MALADAWERLATDLPELPGLVFAGRRRTDNPAFNRRFPAHTNRDGLIEVIEVPSDGELDHLYRNCLFTAFVSLYEGWGLPIGESIAYGKTGVVSHTSSMPEVAEDLMLYADPHDVDSIAAALRRLLTEPGLREGLEAKIATRRLRTWEEVARDMLAVAYDEESDRKDVAASASG
jgi:glycosyltransferase involved in cell wall biosynthesis